MSDLLLLPPARGGMRQELAGRFALDSTLSRDGTAMFVGAVLLCAQLSSRYNDSMQHFSQFSTTALEEGAAVSISHRDGRTEAQEIEKLA